MEKLKRLPAVQVALLGPQLSRDGKLLAFVKRIDTKSVLFIHDLATGEEWPVYDKLNKDQQEAWAIFGVYTGFNWMPDNKSIVIWSGGKINSINLEVVWPLQKFPSLLDVHLKIAETLEFENPVSPDKFTAKVIRHAVTSPDGKTLVFNALGYLWSKQLPNGKPKRITKGTDFEFEPNFSPDGKTIVYVTWNDKELGAIHCYLLPRVESPLKLSSEKGIFRTPSYSSDGLSIVYLKESGNNEQGHSFAKNAGIYIMECWWYRLHT